MQKAGLVLIETYWNVKLRGAYTNVLTDSCINRNILECKDFRNEQRTVDGIRVLIETYWNVKSRPAAEPASEPSSINRNILECKGVTPQTVIRSG